MSSSTNKATSSNWKTQFDTQGYVIVKAAISPDRAGYYRDKQLSWLEDFHLGFQRSDPSTWTAASVPTNYKSGIYSTNAVAHENFMWEARLEQGIQAPFAQIWNTTNLLVSFDGMNVTFPPENNNKIAPWPHTDQNAADRAFLCAQGLLNTGPCGPHDGGLILMAGSAALWTSFWESDMGKRKLATDRKQFKDDGSQTERDLTKFTETEVAWFAKRGCELRKLELEPGDFVIWDSRTIHYSCAPEGKKVGEGEGEGGGGGQIRSAIYVCYGPAEMAGEGELSKKRELFYSFRGSNHWAHRNILGLEHGRGERTRPAEMPEATERMLQLAGVEPYPEAEAGR